MSIEWRTPAWAAKCTTARGRSVALLGLPSSGKTSYLYALTHTSARGRHRWVIGLHTKEFERLTGDANERQEGTPVGEFRPARLFGRQVAYAKWQPLIAVERERGKRERRRQGQ